MRRPGALLVAVAATLASAPPGFAATVPCGGSTRCTRVAVPLDRSAGARTISLHVQRAPSSGPQARTLFVLAGGPGESASARLDTILAVLGRRMRRHWNVVVFDARGTGRSGLVLCPALQRDTTLRSTAAAAECARRLGGRRSHYTTRDNVEDLEAVRVSLGVQRIALYGTSYGTKVALAYAAAYKHHVDRLLLDSVVVPGAPSSFRLDSFAAMPRVLRRLCPRRCHGVTDDLFADTAALVGQLRRGPLAGATYDARGKRRPRTIDRVGLLELLLQADLDPVVRSGLPIAITAARRSDPATLLRLAAAAEVHSLPAPRRFSAGVYAATTCEELDPPWDPSATPPARLAQATARLSSIPDAAFAPFDRETALAGGLVPLCLAWPFPSAPPALPRPPLAGVRTLILAGADDLRTPLENARKVATQLPRASVLTVPGVGHGVLGSVLRGSVVASNARVCVRLAVARFLAAGGGPTRCPPSKPPRPAALPPSSLATLAPVAGVSGKSGRTLRALDLTLDDVAFVLKLFAGRGGGLRGGSVRLGAGGPRLRSFEYIPGVRVSGRPGDRGRLVLRISGPAPSSGTVVLASDGHVRGRLGGRRVSARLTGGPPSPDRRTSTAD